MYQLSFEPVNLKEIFHSKVYIEIHVNGVIIAEPAPILGKSCLTKSAAFAIACK